MYLKYIYFKLSVLQIWK